MTWRIVTPEAIYPRIEDTQDTALIAIGSQCLAEDQGLASAGEFIFLLGVANTVVGSVVKYNASTGVTTLALNTVNQGGPCAIAMAATTAGLFGWYMITGPAVIKKTAAAALPDAKIYMSTTAGRIQTTLTTGRQIIGARTANTSTVTSTTSTVTVTISRPSFMGSAA